ncbi:MAG: guanine deaminase [Pseudomonadota bacterium]
MTDRKVPSFKFALRGAVADTPAPDSLRTWDDALVLVAHDGELVAVLDADEDLAIEIIRTRGDDIRRLGAHEVLLPGLVDLHIHAPQWPQMGQALQVPLEDWLQQHTFPLEARYDDVEFARRSYRDLVQTLLANGTTTGLYFGTIHNEATLLLAQICLEQGQRALVGRLAMDNPDECPDFYRDPSTLAALDGTRAFIEDVRALPGNEQATVKPVVTPRFIPSCTDKCLEGLGEIAAETKTHVQTHVSESDWEHNYVLERHGKSDTQSLSDFGLVTRHSVLAHGPMLSADDMDQLVAQGAAVAHCPLSNIYFSNAVFPLRAALAKGLHVGLGTDISGGPSPSLLENARHAVHSSRMLEEGVDPSLHGDVRGTPDSRIDFVTALYLATRGGGIALDLPIGSFDPGHRFDAIVVDISAPGSNIAQVLEDLPLKDRVQQIVFNAGRQNIAEVWVDGQVVAGSNHN